MFGRWLKSSSAQEEAPDDPLTDLVARELPGRDRESVRVIASISGLLGAVAYADRDFSEAERERVRDEISRVEGMTAEGAEAICAVLGKHALELSTVQAPRYSRCLLELADRELRLEVLQILVDLAAADGVISTTETNLLRQTSKALGLTQDDYNAAQERHRDRLGTLKGP